MELSKQIKEKLKEVDAFDLEGKTDSKIRALEEVEELRTKRADKQSMLLIDAFNKDRASLPQPPQNPSQLSSTPALVPPDPRTQEMINEKFKKAEERGICNLPFYWKFMILYHSLELFFIFCSFLVLIIYSK